jgi:hypothetical protein
MELSNKEGERARANPEVASVEDWVAHVQPVASGGKRRFFVRTTRRQWVTSSPVLL